MCLDAILYSLLIHSIHDDLQVYYMQENIQTQDRPKFTVSMSKRKQLEQEEHPETNVLFVRESLQRLFPYLDGNKPLVLLPPLLPIDFSLILHPPTSLIISSTKESSNSSITPLTSENYHTWANDIKSWLQLNGLWRLVSGLERKPAGRAEVMDKAVYLVIASLIGVVVLDDYFGLKVLYCVRALLQRLFPYLDLLSQVHFSCSWTEISPLVLFPPLQSPWSFVTRVLYGPPWGFFGPPTPSSSKICACTYGYGFSVLTGKGLTPGRQEWRDPAGSYVK
ncbi:hypothetical protein V8E52_008010 [Russula decolorans]